MKKTICMLLALLMLVGMTACGNPEQQNAPVPALRGAVDTETNTYTNILLGFTATFPSNYTFSTSEQMASLNDIAVEAFEKQGDAYNELAKNNQIIYEMCASNNSNDSVTINYENLSKVTQEISDENAYADASIAAIPASLEAIGYTDVVTEKTTVTLAGKEHPAVKINMLYGQFPFYETVVFVKTGNYVANITFTSISEATIQEMIGYFKAM